MAKMISPSGSHGRRVHASMLISALFAVTLTGPLVTTADAGANDNVKTPHPSAEVTSAPPRATFAAGTRVRVSETYAKLPLYFEANRGQSDSRVKFLARGSRQTFFLTSTGMVLALRKREPPAHEPAAHGSPEPRRAATGTVLRMTFAGANPTPRVTGVEELPGKTNYFPGKDPAKWRTNVPNYAKVHYQDLYPGIDLIYYGNQRQLEYDFVVRPGADPARIVLGFAGADRLEVDLQGDLVLHTAAGAIRQRRPVIYQEIEGARRQIPGGYVLKGLRQVGFQAAAYDLSRPLVIDPVLVYSSYVGGSSSDQDAGIAVDAAGNAYVTGLTVSTDFPITSGAFDMTYNGNIDAFVTKLNPAGAGAADLVYSTYLGGSGDDRAFGIAVDAAGNAYVTGLTTSADFPTTLNAFDTTLGGGGDVGDAFVTKLNSDGNGLVYSTYLGGSGQEFGFHRSFSSYTRFGGGIAVDPLGSAYVTGQTNSGDFPTTPDAFDKAFNGGGSDSFVTKLNAAGTGLVYSTYLGGNSSEWGSGIALDGSGSAYVTGFTISNNFPTTDGAFQTTLNGSVDVFVTKLNPLGTGLVYSTYLGGSSDDDGTGIAVDGADSAYVTGLTSSNNFPTTDGAFQTTLNSSVDVFVTKLNPLGTGLVYSTYLGGSSSEIGFGIALDGSGSAYVTGFSFSTDFPTVNASQGALAGISDAFVTKVNPSGTALVYSTYLGGSVREESSGIAVDASGNAYVSGFTSSTDFPTTGGAFDTSFNGTADAFVAKLGLPPATPGCEIVDNGVITASNGDRAVFSGNTQSSESGETEGAQQYRDHGPAQPFTVRSLNVLSIVCENSRATVFGHATIDGAGFHLYEIRVTDGGDPGVGQDTYRIIVPSVPYDSGEQPLQGGNVIIRQN